MQTACLRELAGPELDSRSGRRTPLTLSFNLFFVTRSVCACFSKCHMASPTQGNSQWGATSVIIIPAGL